MVTVTTFIQDGKRFETHKHTLPHFPNYKDMMVFCKRDRIKATDFEHQYKNKQGTFYVGKYVVSGGKSGQVSTGRRGVKFFVRCENKPQYEDWVR